MSAQDGQRFKGHSQMQKRPPTGTALLAFDENLPSDDVENPLIVRNRDSKVGIAGWTGVFLKGGWHAAHRVSAGFLPISELMAPLIL